MRSLERVQGGSERNNSYAHHDIYEERMWACIEIFGQDNLTSDADGEDDESLFGSKCLSDNVATSEPNVDSLAPNVDSLATSSASLSQNPAENCDNENHISKSERLHIAARLLQGLLANAVWVMRKTDLAAKAASDDNTKAAQILTNDLAEDALEFADALIKQAFLK